MEFRVEHDAIGAFRVPQQAYYGIFTARALKNFQLSGLRAPRVYIHALGLIKQACAETNYELGLLDKKVIKALRQAASEFTEGRFDGEFPLDPIQAGAGTPFNMNANEVIANRANELLGNPLGSYEPLHPNNHVNMSQSSNDVTPTALRLAALLLVKPLLAALEKLSASLRDLSQQHRSLIKVGRTHLEDAVPMTLGQEFHAFATMLEKTKKRIAESSRELQEVGLGGTALGSGITTHPNFQKKVVANLAKLSKLSLTPTADLFETTASMNPFVALSSACRMLAIDLVKITNDLKLLNMGPLAGIAEITLPEVEPGSSIMPGKVNPSVAEAAHMAAYDVIAADTAVVLGAQAGQLQLNVMTPLMIKNLLYALTLLTNTCDMLRTDCIEGIIVNKKQISSLLQGSLVTATALSPYLGYEVTAEIVKEALQKGFSVVEVVQEKNLIADKDLERILSAERTTKPAIIDVTLRKKIQNSDPYRKLI